MMLICLLLSLLPTVWGGDILMWLDFGTKSHQALWKPLALKLASRGHHVTFVGNTDDSDLSSNSNITFAYVRQAEEESLRLASKVFGGGKRVYYTYLKEAVKAQRKAFHLPLVQELIEKKPKFDVAIFSPRSNDIGLYLARKVFQAPVVFIHACLNWAPLDDALGNPSNPSYIPAEHLPSFGQRMSFTQRVFNTLARYIIPSVDYQLRISKLEPEIQEMLNLTEAPNLLALTDEVSFGLINSHHLLDGVKPTYQNTAEVGGMHLRPPRVIKNYGNLRQWLDSATDGFIYVSFGTGMNSKSMPHNIRQKLTSAFQTFANKSILWKWETKTADNGTSSGMLLKKWLPQQDVLGHSNCKLFVTHGGLLSMYESLYHGVAMVVMPGYGDQFSNAEKVVRKGFGKMVQWDGLEVQELVTTIHEVLEDPSYQERVTDISAVLRDNLVHPMDRAIYHIEYVMRHQGAHFLRPPSKDLYWFQYYLLDIILFMISFTVILACLLGGVIHCMWKSFNFYTTKKFKTS